MFMGDIPQLELRQSTRACVRAEEASLEVLVNGAESEALVALVRFPNAVDAT